MTATDEMMECPDCEGTGEVSERCPACSGWLPGPRVCGRCGDTGWLEFECATCEGTGKVLTEDFPDDTTAQPD